MHSLRGRAAARIVALVAALGVQVLLLGLSEAHHSLPGDVFQVARPSAAATTTTVASAFPDPGRNHNPAAPSFDSVAALLAGGFAAPVCPPTHGDAGAGLSARLPGASGCRGPPLQG